MSLWSAQLGLPVHAWLPLGLAALAPLLLVAVIVPISRRRGRGIATVLTLRTVLVLATGFAMLAGVASVAIVQTGLSELNERHRADVRSVADGFAHTPLGLAAGDGQLRLTLLRAKDPDLAFVLAGTDGCRSTCQVSFADRSVDQQEMKRAVMAAWPTSSAQRMTISLGGRPYLLVSAPMADVSGKPRSAVVAGVSAASLAGQAERTAWLLLAMSYSLLLIVGWTSWQQVTRSLANRIDAIKSQLTSGIADESHESFEVAGHELRELADSVSTYIKRTLAEKSSSEERYRKLAEMSPDAVIMCSDTRIRAVNPAAIALTGAKNRADLVASPIHQFLTFEEGRRESDKSGELRPGTWKRMDGSTRHVEVAEITDTSGGEVIRQFVVRDITNRRLREAALMKRAEHDALTGLVNRARFEASLAELLASTRAPKNPDDQRHIVAMYIDLDGFKPVNDTYGHAAGDAVLVAVADRLRESTRGTDVIARLGGDEFAVLLEVREMSEVQTVANRILEAIRQPIVTESAAVLVGASLGVASTQTHGAGAERPMSPAELLKAADAAMYDAKSTGGDGYRMAGRDGQSPRKRSDVRFPALA